MSQPEHTIEVEHLVKRYAGVVAVNDVSFRVGKGEIVGFLGPNGAGKSTTMRILTGFIPATSGSARICGYPLSSHASEVRRLIGYMPENNPLPSDMRVIEYLRLRGLLKGLRGPSLRKRIDEVLELSDLARARRRIIGALSKGYRQRVGIAEAILAEPQVIIMDEPTIGLDPHQIVMIRDLIAGLRGRMTILLSSHILPEIEITCDRAIIINSGRVVAADTPEALRREFIGRTAYRVECDLEPGAFAAALGKLGPEAPVLDGHDDVDAAGFRCYRLSTEGDTDAGEALFRVLATMNGCRVKTLHKNRPTLEDVFLAATRRSWEALLPMRSTPGKNEPANGEER